VQFLQGNYVAHLKDIPPRVRASIEKLACATYDSTPFTTGGPLRQRRVAILSTAGLHRRGDTRFKLSATDYRIIPAETTPADLLMSHVSINYDRTGYIQDLNTVFPLERLKDMQSHGEIGAVADRHYAFMGATDPAGMSDEIAQVAGMMKADRVDAVLLVPV